MVAHGLRIRVIPKAEEAHVSASSFIAVMEHTLAILREVDAEISEQRRSSLDWHITQMTSNRPLTLTLVGEPTLDDVDVSLDVLEAYADGLRQLDTSPDRIPEFYTLKALTNAKNLVSVLNNGVEQGLFSVPTRGDVSPTQRVAANVDDLTRTYEELTSFEGTLERVNVHGRNRFYVWDVFDGRISCRFSDKQLEEVRQLFGQRVSVYGKARFSRTGRPLGIEVYDLKRLRSQSELPQPHDFVGVNITGSLSSEDYVRGLRDDE